MIMSRRHFPRLSIMPVNLIEYRAESDTTCANTLKAPLMALRRS